MAIPHPVPTGARVPMEPFRERLPVCHRSARYHFEWDALARSMPYSACKRFAYFTTLNLFLKALGNRHLARKQAILISAISSAYKWTSLRLMCLTRGIAASHTAVIESLISAWSRLDIRYRSLQYFRSRPCNCYDC